MCVRIVDIIQHKKEISYQTVKRHNIFVSERSQFEKALFWRRQNYGDSKKMNRTGKDESTSKEDF